MSLRGRCEHNTQEGLLAALACCVLMRGGWHAVQTVLWSLGGSHASLSCCLSGRLATLCLLPHPLSACIDDQYWPIFSHATISCFSLMFVSPLAGLHQDQ